MDTQVEWHPARIKGRIGQAVFESQVRDDVAFIFVAEKSGKTEEDQNQTLWFRCEQCRHTKTKLDRPNEAGKPPRGQIINGRWQFNPELNHFCVENGLVETSAVAIAAKRVYRLILQRAASGDLTYSEAHRSQFDRCRALYSNHPRYDDIKRLLPDPSYAKRAIRKATQREKPAIIDAHNIDAEESVIERPLGLGAGQGNRWLRYINEDANTPPMLIFAEVQGLATLRHYRHWTSDGTFKRFPRKRGDNRSFKQLYTVHSLINDLPERTQGTPCVYALLPSKTREVYRIMWQAINDMIIAEHGDIGEPKTLMCDCEYAAINSFKEVFPDSTNFTCCFHMQYAINKNCKKWGLEKILNDHPEYVTVKQWLRLFTGAALLPNQMALDFVILILINRPEVESQRVNELTERFAIYFQRWWVPRINDWVHWSNDGGWHAALKDKIKGDNPLLHDWIIWMNQYQEVNAHEQDRLIRGVQQPRARKVQYVETDRRINEAKAQLIQELNEHRANNTLVPMRRIIRYVGHQSHNLGRNSKPRRILANAQPVHYPDEPLGLDAAVLDAMNIHVPANLNDPAILPAQLVQVANEMNDDDDVDNLENQPDLPALPQPLLIVHNMNNNNNAVPHEGDVHLDASDDDDDETSSEEENNGDQDYVSSSASSENESDDDMDITGEDNAINADHAPNLAINQNVPLPFMQPGAGMNWQALFYQQQQQQAAMQMYMFQQHQQYMQALMQFQQQQQPVVMPDLPPGPPPPPYQENAQQE